MLYKLLGCQTTGILTCSKQLYNYSASSGDVTDVLRDNFRIQRLKVGSASSKLSSAVDKKLCIAELLRP